MTTTNFKRNNGQPSQPIDWDCVPRPPAAETVHLAHVGTIALLCIVGFVWSAAEALLLAVCATALRYALVGWLTKRAYAPSMAAWREAK